MRCPIIPLLQFITSGILLSLRPKHWRTWANVVLPLCVLGGMIGWAVHIQFKLMRLQRELQHNVVSTRDSDSVFQVLESRLDAWQHQPAAAWESYALQGPDDPLGFPVVYAVQSRPPVRYEPKRKGLKVFYTGNHFEAGAQKGVLYCPLSSGPGDPPSLATAPDGELAEGEEFTIQDDAFYDFAVGVLFVKVLRHKNNQPGFMNYATLIGETTTAPDRAGLQRIRSGKAYLQWVFPHGVDELEVLADEMEQGLFLGKGQTFHPDKTNPVSCGSRVAGALLSAMHPKVPEDLRRRVLAGGERFFREYGFPQAKPQPGGGVAWSYPMEWPMDWKITLRPPWYSGYGNAVMALSAAILYHHTGKEAYRELAHKAVRFLETPTRDGGALYYQGRFPHLAEYAYPSPPLPNVRILDGEMVSVLCVYNTAVILRDSAMLNLATRLVAGLSADLESFTTRDGKVLNARYPWLIDNANYLNSMKIWAGQLAEAGKDLRFVDAARRWNLSSATWR